MAVWSFFIDSPTFWAPTHPGHTFSLVGTKKVLCMQERKGKNYYLPFFYKRLRIYHFSLCRFWIQKGGKQQLKSLDGHQLVFNTIFTSEWVFVTSVISYVHILLAVIRHKASFAKRAASLKSTLRVASLLQSQSSLNVRCALQLKWYFTVLHQDIQK